MADVHYINFPLAKETKEREKSPLYRRVKAAEDPEEKLLALAQAVVMEPYPQTLEQLRESSESLKENNPESPVGWYAKAVYHFFQDHGQEAYNAMMNVYQRRHNLPHISAVCLSVLSTMRMSEAVRDLTDKFIEAAVLEDPFDELIISHAEYGAQRTGFEDLERLVMHAKGAARFRPNS